MIKPIQNTYNIKRISFSIVSFFFLMIVYAQKSDMHTPFDKLLKQFVNEKGMVDYTSLKSEETKLNEYLKSLADHPPQDSWSKNEKLAYWINAYNGYTLALVLQHYPIKSIRDIGSVIQVPFVNSPWDVEFIKIAGKTYDLNNLEHDIIRKQFDESRIHFALVCAAISCPKLLNHVYLPETLDAQLDQAAKNFLNDASKNEILSSNKAIISPLFNWYEDDFTKKTTLRKYLSQYSSYTLSPKAKVGYKDYDWTLNDQK